MDDFDDVDEVNVDGLPLLSIGPGLSWRKEFRGPYALYKAKGKEPHAYALLFRDPAMKSPSINLGNFPDKFAAARGHDAALAAIGKQSYNFPGEVPDAVLVERFKARLIPLLKPVPAP